MTDIEPPQNVPPNRDAQVAKALGDRVKQTQSPYVQAASGRENLGNQRPPIDIHNQATVPNKLKGVEVPDDQGSEPAQPTKVVKDKNVGFLEKDRITDRVSELNTILAAKESPAKVLSHLVEQAGVEVGKVFSLGINTYQEAKNRYPKSSIVLGTGIAEKIGGVVIGGIGVATKNPTITEFGILLASFGHLTSRAADAHITHKETERGVPHTLESETLPSQYLGNLTRVTAETFGFTAMFPRRIPESKLGGAALVLSAGTEAEAFRRFAQTGEPKWMLAMVGAKASSLLIQRLDEDIPKLVNAVKEHKKKKIPYGDYNLLSPETQAKKLAEYEALSPEAKENERRKALNMMDPSKQWTGERLFKDKVDSTIDQTKNLEWQRKEEELTAKLKDQADELKQQTKNVLFTKTSNHVSVDDIDAAVTKIDKGRWVDRVAGWVKDKLGRAKQIAPTPQENKNLQ